MATRNDVTVDFSQSPRIIEVAAPSIEIVIQDIVDTIRISESSFQGMSETRLIDAAGKEDLGGGVSVAITSEFKDAQIAFEPRTTAAQIGAVTISSSTPIKDKITFSDANANFGTAQVQRGSLVINFSDESIADVVNVNSNIELTTRTLKNGLTNSFTIGDNYAVFNVVQIILSGGNQVAVNANNSAIPAILPTAFTQIISARSSSATLINANSASDSGAIATAVWDKTSSTANSVGSIGAVLNSLPDAEETANAVWNYDLSANVTANSAHGKMVIIQKILQNKSITDPDTGIMTIYDDDNITPFLIAPIYQDKTTGTPYQGQGIERREKLT